MRTRGPCGTEEDFARKASFGLLSSPGASARVELAEALRLLAGLTPGRPGDRPEGVERDAPLLVPPRARNGAVDEERRHRLRVLRVEDEAAVALREDLGAACVRQQRRVPGGQEPYRSRRPGIGERRAGEVEELPAALVAEASQLGTRDDRPESRRGCPSPAGDVVFRGGFEAPSIQAVVVFNTLRIG